MIKWDAGLFQDQFLNDNNGYDNADKNQHHFKLKVKFAFQFFQT